jgi:hypothetical protein
MRQEGAREGSPTPQKHQSSNKEEGSSDKDHQVKRHGVREKFRESIRQNKPNRRTQGGQQDKQRKGTDFHLRVMESGPITKICLY